MTTHGPRRVVCLTSETAKIAFAVGAGDRVVGVTAFANLPEFSRARRVSAFTTANVPAILELKPDLVLAFSELQRDIVRDLLYEGVSVLATNQRSLQEIYDTTRLIGNALGYPREAEALAARMEQEVRETQDASRKLPSRPRVYFEEWNEPLITGIAWVSEILEAAGGDDVFPEMRAHKRAPDRVVDPDEVARRDPQIVFASWCGKPVDGSAFTMRPGWEQVSAVRAGRIYEIPGADILSPGPGILRGLRSIHAKIRDATIR